MKQATAFPSQGAGPYSNGGFNKIYELLFCDKLELYRANDSPQSVYPWNYLFAEKPDKAQLLEMMDDKTLRQDTK